MKTGLLICVLVVIGMSPAAQAPLAFSDQTAASGLIHTHLPSTSYHLWHYSGAGAALDYDRDGRQDLFLLSGYNAGIPDRVFHNNGDGTFTDLSLQLGLSIVHDGRGIAVGDYDSDGFQDVFITSVGDGDKPNVHLLYRNLGGTTFVEVAQQAGVNSTFPYTPDGNGACFGDYDVDGDLDLFVAGWQPGNTSHKLFRNNGDDTFTDATAASQLFLGELISLNALTPRFADLDGDRHPELLLVNDFGTSRLYQNDRDGTFTNITTSAGVGLEENGMGGTVGDFNNDGQLDWYVSSIFRPTFGWTGNKLYTNRGSLRFDESAVQQGVHVGGYGWGCIAVDLNHDGLVDLVETNGDNQPSGLFFQEQSYLFRNDGGSFTEVAVSAGFTHAGDGRGLVNFDADGDGDMDVLVIPHEEPVQFFRNDLAGPDTHWLRVFLDTSGCADLAPDGYGTHVIATAGANTYHRWVGGGDDGFGQSELSAHFGLGAASVVDDLRVEWSNGTNSRMYGVATDQTLVLKAPSSNTILLEVDTTELSLTAGGTQQLTIDASPTLQGSVYAVLGSTSGDLPGFTFGSHTIPLNIDPYTLLTLNVPTAFMASRVGFLDSAGDASATFALPATMPVGLLGVYVHHAAIALDPASLSTVLAVSNSHYAELLP